MISKQVRIVAVAAAILGTAAALAAPPADVTTGDDGGPGSLREALASGASSIYVAPTVTRIEIDSTLAYTGTEALRIVGLGQTIRANRGDSDFTLLESSNGGNLIIQNLNFDGGGGFDFDHPGVGKGIYIKVPEDRTGIVRLELENVRVRGVANHGIHVSDCTLGDACGSGGGGGGEGSPASIHAVLRNVRVTDAGNGKFDADGLRIDERADGGIMLDAWRSDFTGIGADGIELDEGNDGDVHLNVRDVILENNGGYCLPAPLELAQPCVEDDDGELVLDLDDAFDVDEAGSGSILGLVFGAFVTGNLDEGIDFDEEDDGGANLQFTDILAFGNGDEGIKFSGAGEGNLDIRLYFVDVFENGNDGIEIENEDGSGEVHVDFRSSTSRDNDDDGLQVSQENEESPGTLTLRDFFDIDSIDLENIVQR